MRVLAVAFTAAAAKSSEAQLANPIRRVVSLLQSMQSKIEAEGEEQDKMFSKFQCYCEKNAAKLSDAVSEAKSKIESLATDIESAQEDRTQTVADLASAKENRASSQQAIKDATAQRDKDAAAYKEMSEDLSTNIAALGKAIPAIEGGMGGAFLQTQGSVLRKVLESTKVSEMDRATVEAFLQAASGSSAGYAPQSGEIVGILKQMKDTMEKDLAEAKAAEESAVADFNELVASQNKAIQAATDTIELKTEESGTLAVQIVKMQNDKADTEDQLKADTGFSAQLEEDCAQQAKDYAQVKQTRADELLAIADTIKILNDDDVLELFKKTLPSPSLLQVKTTRSEVTQRVVAALQSVKHSPRADLIMMALRGKKEGFEKVAALVDKMMASLKEEQKDDDEKVAFCKAEIDKAEDEGKELKNKLHSTATRISAAEDTISTTKSEIAALDESIKELDAAVEQATAMRKEEHEDYTEEAADNNAALQLLGMAKNRLNKFYHPKDHKEPEQEEEEESFVQIRSHRDAPEAAPEVQGHSKSDTGGVLGLMDMLIQDLKKEMQENEFVEKNAQEDYETLVADSKAKRAADASARSEKKGTLAEAEAELLDLKSKQRDTMSSAEGNAEYLAQLHGNCDWNMENYDARKSARAEELESLKKAKDIINGADFSLLQTRSGATLLNKARRA
mmetsp:Transcript_81926/g.219162  ORF Transcript_81926/g.219162 Transcript_81926/m.219162 type:complete len:679 (+) Transcript_81926:111-2147(+)